MTIDLIQEKAKEYQQALKERNAKHDMWHSSAKIVISSTLNEIKQNTSLDWRIGNVEGSGLNSISLIIEKHASGVVIDNKEQMKFGGTLSFSTDYKGDIHVILLYPHVGDHIQPIPTKVLASVAPAALTKQFVITQVAIFLDEITAWEKGKTVVSKALTAN